MLQLFKYQDQGRQFLSSPLPAGMKGRACWDEMGLGKTAQGIRSCDDMQYQKILVLCPAVARINWTREFKKFQTVPRFTQYITNSKQRIRRVVGVTVVNYDLIIKPGIFSQLMAMQWDALIIDEGHFLKNPESKRTIAVFGKDCAGGEDSLVSRAGMVYHLTGTPSPNNASELFPVLRALYPQAVVSPRTGAYMNFYSFTNRYCVVKQDQIRVNGKIRHRKKILRNQNAGALREAMGGFYIRRKLEEVELDLPPLTMTQFALAFEDAFDELLEHEGVDLKEARRLHREALAGKVDMSKLMESDSVSTIMRITGDVRCQLAIDVLREELPHHNEKIVLMCWHRNVALNLANALDEYGVVNITGRETSAQKQESVDAFQEDPTVRVAVCQIRSAGTAITLTAGSRLDFVERSWVPADNAQALKRVLRIGQGRRVLGRLFYIPNSIDEALSAVNYRKMQDAKKLLGE